MDSLPRGSSSKDPLLSIQPHHARQATKRRPLSRLLLVSSALTLFGLTCFSLSRRLPYADSEVHLRATSLNAEEWWESSSHVVAPGISMDSFKYGLAQCEAIKDRASRTTNTTRQRHRNPRSANKGQVLIKNGHIWLGDSYFDGDLLIQDGLIRSIGQDLTADDDAVVFPANGRVITPGIVDMHSHMTVDSFPGLEALDDTNEMTQPMTPFVRVLDALNPSDPAIKVVSSGGVTTSLILPGSGNLMGGEAAAIKLRPVPTLSVQDMLVTAGVQEEDQEVIWRYMKMACGENPKSYYGSFPTMPMTRLGENYLFRRWFSDARDLLRRQDDWCDAAELISKTMSAMDASKDTVTRLSERFPEFMSLESLVALLRHDVNLNVHCYLPQDIEAMVRHSTEFDFDIAAFHHALSAWQVPEVIKRAKNNITVATFADMWGYKAEAWNQNVHAPKILDSAGIPVAFKSDHPVMNSRDVLHEAQKAYHYGFNEHKALAALTSVPATSLGLFHRIGSIEVGKDADLVIWERHPLRLGARPHQVFVDGQVLDYNQSWTKNVDELFEPALSEQIPIQAPELTPNDRHLLPPRSTNSMQLEDHGTENPMSFEDACTSHVDSFVLRRIGQLFMSAEEHYDRASLDGGDIYLVVHNNTIACAGPECDRDHVQWPEGVPVFDMNNAVIIPGIISSGTPLGLAEISAEPSTWDGVASNDVKDPDLSLHIVRAVDGLKLHGLRLEKAFRAGVTSAVSSPIASNSLLSGVAVTFHTGIKDTVLDGNGSGVIREETALHFTLVHGGKQTISQQLASIRQLLIDNAKKDANTNVLARAAKGLLPVVVETDDKDEIATLIQMKQHHFDATGHSVRFVILGGASSHLVADHLARQDIAVILRPARCYATSWAARYCLAGPPLTSGTVIDALLQHGVRVGISSADLDNGDARNLIWESGWNLAHNSNFSPSDAVGLVTWNVAEIFGLQTPGLGTIRKGGLADFVAYNGSPFEFGSRVLMVHSSGHDGPLCFPEQV